MKKILFAILLMAQPAWANISIFPYSVNFEAESNKRIKSVRVINTSDEVHTYRVSVINFNQDENGKLTEVKEESKLFADKYLNYSPRQFILKPNEMQTINVARKGMAQAPNGEFVSHLKVSEVNLGKPEPKKSDVDNNTLSMKIKALFAVTIPVTVTKGDNLVAKTEIGQYKLLPSNKLQLELKRLGNRSSRVNVVVYTAHKKEIGRINNIKVYLTTAKLNVQIPLTARPKNKNLILKLENAETKEEILSQNITL